MYCDDTEAELQQQQKNSKRRRKAFKSNLAFLTPLEANNFQFNKSLKNDCKICFCDFT